MMLAAGSVAAQPKPAAATARRPAAARPPNRPRPPQRRPPAPPRRGEGRGGARRRQARRRAAAAAPATPPPPPKPAAELDTFKFFLGKWKCDGKAFASPMSPTEHAVKGSAEAKLEVDNFWQSFTYEEKKTKEHPGLKVNGCWGYDQGAKRFVRAAVGNHGEWDTASAPGWEGDKLVWTGELSGPMGRVPFHHTLHQEERQGVDPPPGAAPAGRKMGPGRRHHLQKVVVDLRRFRFVRPAVWAIMPASCPPAFERLTPVVVERRCCSAPATARAQDKPVDPKVAAKEHYTRGTSFYDLGRYDDAIKEFEAAYQLKNDPAFLYNLAQSYRQAGNHEQAVHFYKTYLRYVPKAPNRADIEEKIKTRGAAGREGRRDDDHAAAREHDAARRGTTRHRPRTPRRRPGATSRP